MVKKDAEEKIMDDYLSGTSSVSRTYRKGAREEPPARLDAAILAQARRAGAPSSRGRRISPVGFWIRPLSAAAVVVLSLILVLFMAREGVPPLQENSVPVPTTDERGANPGAVGETPAATPNAREEPKKPPAGAEPRAAVPPASAVIEKADRFTKTAPLAPSFADIASIRVSGTAGAYRFLVGIKSPDAGCRQYADWWEVVSEDGRLLYRLVLPNSHTKEQPFMSGGGPVPIQPDTVVWIRAHMHSAGYGGVAFKGSVRAGFRKTDLSPAFAAQLAKVEPLPKGCKF